MTPADQAEGTETETPQDTATPMRYAPRIIPPPPNYTLSSVCPQCGTETFRLSCKVRCPKCGFMWDCSEL